MASDQMVSVSSIWQLGHIGKVPDIIAEVAKCLNVREWRVSAVSDESVSQLQKVGLKDRVLIGNSPARHAPEK